MRVHQGEAIEGSDTSAATAAADLTARVDDLVHAFGAHVTTPIDAATLDALRADVLELAKAHAARTVLDLATAKQQTPRRNRRPWGRRP